jgi:pilus assembly protein Flp/PilA
MKTPDLYNFFRPFTMDECGSNALEYGLIVGFVSLAVVAGATAAGVSFNAMFTALAGQIGTLTATITA